MTFNSNFAAFQKIQSAAGNICCFYTNDGIEVVPSWSEMHQVEAVATSLKEVGFQNVKVVGRKFKKILVNHISMETARAIIISIEY